MFESIVVRNLLVDENTFDAGLLAETLLFYQNVHITVDRGSLKNLIDGIGADHIVRLIDDEHMSLSFEKNLLGVQTVNLGGVDVHEPLQFSSHSKFKNRFSKEEDIISVVSRTVGSSRNARKAARRLIDKTPLETAFDRLEGATLPGMVSRDLEDVEFVNRAALSILRAIVPEVPLSPDTYFHTEAHAGGGFVVRTNVPFNAINAIWASPERGEMTPALLISYVGNARADQVLSAIHMAELVTSPLSEAIITDKFSTMLSKRRAMNSEIKLFQSTHVGARTIREVINSGERGFAEFLPILDASKRFKAEFLKGADRNVGLLKEYHHAVTRDSWADRLPTKSVRFVAFTGAGLFLDALVPTGVATATGLALGATDTFLLDRLVKGWRPNQFVEQKLVPFVGAD